METEPGFLAAVKYGMVAPRCSTTLSFSLAHRSTCVRQNCPRTAYQLGKQKLEGVWGTIHPNASLQLCLLLFLLRICHLIT